MFYKESSKEHSKSFGNRTGCLVLHVLTCRRPTESSSSIQELEHTIKERFQPGATDERIRIAVLDTGMDDGEYAKNENKELKKPPWKRVVARSNFCVPKEEDLNANTHDLDGHGTKVASIILRLAENVDLYIARVCRGADVEEADRNKDTEFKDPEPAVVARVNETPVQAPVSMESQANKLTHFPPL